MTCPIALVTGSNRGLGLETCRQLAARGFDVIATARDLNRCKKELGGLLGRGVSCEQLNVTSTRSIERLRQVVRRNFGRLDVLVNNAGVNLDSGWPVVAENVEEASAFRTGIDTLRASMETNAFGPFRLCQTFIPLMLEHSYGRVVNVSTSMAQLSTMTGGWPAYRLSKVALNAVTRVFAAELAGTDVLINSVSPGWVRTDMGGPHAPLSVTEGVDTIVWLATLPKNGPTGSFFRSREVLDW